MNINEIFPKCALFFSTYFRIVNDETKNIFTYQNDTATQETVYAIIFTSKGKDGEWKVITTLLPPYAPFVLTTKDIAREFPGVNEGSILLALAPGVPFEVGMLRKEYVSNWLSEGSGTFTSAGPFTMLNTLDQKKSKSFFMFSPVVYKKGFLNTFNVLVNHSTDPDYADSVEVVPELSNLKGGMLVGSPILIAPFGSVAIDIEKVFGKAGLSLLENTGGYGTMTVKCFGHILISYFFEADGIGKLLCGNHTQPPVSIFLSKKDVRSMFKDEIKKKFPFLLRIKHRNEMRHDTVG